MTQQFSSVERFHIKTFGCQMNVSDSERMAAVLQECGWQESSTSEDADLIIINGCMVREKALHKASSALGEFALMKRTRNDASGKPWLGVGGCVGQAEQNRLFSRAPDLDFIFGTDTIDSLPEILHRLRSGERRVRCADFDQMQGFSTETKWFVRQGEKRAAAYVSIMKGCDKFCSYCIVPFTRGREKSRTIAEVVRDCIRLAEQGVKEVTLLGQNVNSFGKKSGETFVQLLRAIDSEKRCSLLSRIRFTSSHPLDFSDELLNCFATAGNNGVTRLAPHLHLAVQSGSNAVLESMNRRHKIEDYIIKMNRLRELNPEIGLSTDLIVGFPGETEEDFQQTLRLLDAVQFDSVYAFSYSPREGTMAAKQVDDVSAEEKSRRLNSLLDYQLKISSARYRSRVGRQFEVLVEGEAKNSLMNRTEEGIPIANTDAENEPRVWTGRTGCNRVVNFMAPPKSVRNLVGELVQVRISQASALALQGELI